MSSTTFIIHFHATESRLPEFLQAMQKLTVELPQVSGCSAVTVHQDQGDTARFTVVESWDSPSEHEDHVAGLVVDGTWKRISSLLRSEPSGSYFNSL